MKIYRAIIINSTPYNEAEIKRDFYDKENADRWIKSFGKGKYIRSEIKEIIK